MGELPIIWCRLSCIILCFQMEGKCWWRHRAEQLKAEKERGRGRLPSPLVCQCKLLTRQASPSSPSLCCFLAGCAFAWEIAMPRSLVWSFEKRSAIVSLGNKQLLLCTCRKTHWTRVTFSSWQLWKVCSSFLSKTWTSEIWIRGENVLAKD